MKDTSSFYFQSYSEWYNAITTRCNIKLTNDYIETRVKALKDSHNPQTREFTEKYGTDYVNQVIDWFERAGQD
jgi:hypothetical protein